ncbi:MAG: hypothetical protein FJW86_12940 [Actinobacteria bacterium]|nr:hypothetical protein [Actinomycetota bacterium]
MLEDVKVRFAIDAPPHMNRHRLSVRDENGSLLSGPTAERSVDFVVRPGATLHVEASVPSTPDRNLPGRDERAWELRAAADAHRVLNLGKRAKNGRGTAIEITVDGAS